MDSENNKTSELSALILKLTHQLNLRRGEKMLLYQALVFITHGKKIKSFYNNKKCKISNME